MQRCIPFFGASARYLLSIGYAGLATRKIQLPKIQLPKTILTIFKHRSLKNDLNFEGLLI
jgi:hypothetical protein